ncbi:hypothetical protein [Streptomyces sp. NPDC048172]|uniref:hypothetical protein n=1 Tax=Streptomyces sp. NPDC048172 TaxID=3365505 RepID=UPI00371CF371
MNDDDHQARTEQQRMLRRAEELSRTRKAIRLPHAPDDLPTLAHASAQLADLARLVQDLTQEVHARGDTQQHDPGFDAAVGAWARAAGILSEAVGHYGAAYRQLGFLHAHRHTPEHTALRNGHRTAFTLAQERIADARDRLSSARGALDNSAAVLEGPDGPSVSRAARASSTYADPARSQAPPDVEAPADTPAQQPPRAPGVARGR